MDLDADLILGARNAIRVCMNVGPQDRAFITTDDETLDVGRALEREARAVGAPVELARLEEFGERPMAQMPQALGARLTAFSPSVTLLAVTAKEGELPLRGGFLRMALASWACGMLTCRTSQPLACVRACRRITVR